MMESGLSQFALQNPAALLLLVGIPAIALLFNYAQRRRLAARKRFFLEVGGRDVGQRKSTISALGLCGAYLFVCLALPRPGWNPRPEERLRQGRDVAFVLDVSRSMLAQDVAPNRLDRAKSAIADCLEEMAGDRVGLVVFAGAAEVKCPLTVDYDCFRKILSDCDHRSIPRGGSMLGAGIDMVVAKLLAESKPGYQDVILISDGEDHGSEIDAAVSKLEDSGARLIVLGIGNPKQGSPIPVADAERKQDSHLQYKGQTVLTRLHSARLRGLVASSDMGVYFDVGTGRIDLGKIYRQLIVKAQREMIEAQGLIVYDEGFQVFIAIALLLLAVSAWPLKSGVGRGNRTASLLIVAGLLVLRPSFGLADSARADFERGLDFYSSGNYSEALDAFEAGLVKRSDAFPLRYNIGVTHYTLGNYARAEESFAQALEQADGAQNQARSLYNLGNTLYRQAEALIGKDLPSARRTLARSSACYRRVLDIKPDSEDAAYNLEIANTLAAVVVELEKAKKMREQQDAETESDEEGEKGEKKPKPSDRFEQTDQEAEEGKRYLMPTEDPEDILEEERRANEDRLERIEQQAEGVEKDW